MVEKHRQHSAPKTLKTPQELPPTKTHTTQKRGTTHDTHTHQHHHSTRKHATRARNHPLTHHPTHATTRHQNNQHIHTHQQNQRNPTPHHKPLHHHLRTPHTKRHLLPRNPHTSNHPHTTTPRNHHTHRQNNSTNTHAIRHPPMPTMPHHHTLPKHHTQTRTRKRNHTTPTNTRRSSRTHTQNTSTLPRPHQKHTTKHKGGEHPMSTSPFPIKTPAPPQKLNRFTKDTTIGLREIARISGINIHLLENAKRGNIELDTAHLMHLAYTTPGVNHTDIFTKTRLQRPHACTLEGKIQPTGTHTILIPGHDIQTGDYLRYEDEKGRHTWIIVTDIPPRQPHRQTFTITASRVPIIIYANRLIWVARPTNEENNTTQETEQ